MNKGRIRMFIPHSWTGWAMIIIVLLTLAATIFSWKESKSRIEADARNNFEVEVTKVDELLDDRIQAYIDTLYAFRGFFHASESVNNKEFQAYLNSLDVIKNYPGFNTINYVTHVPRDQVSRFTAQMRANGQPNFQITTAGEREDYYIVTYIGVGGAATDPGVDLGASSERRKTLEAARDSGKPTATDTLNLLGKKGQPQNQPGFLITIPIYQDTTPNSLNERLNQLDGFVNAVFSYEILLGDTLGNALPTGLGIKVNDTKGQSLYQQGEVRNKNQQSKTIAIEVADKTWNATLFSDRLFGINRSQAALPNVILTAGLLLTTLLGVVFWLQNRARIQAVKLAREMTKDLRQERNNAVEVKNKDEAILASIGDGVFALDQAGQIILFNKAAESISGWRAQDMLGKPYEDVLHFVAEDTQKPEKTFIKTAQAGTQSTMRQGTLLRHQQGHFVPVADSAAPVFDAQGVQRGIIIVFRDISKERDSQRKIEESNQRFEMIAKATSEVVHDLNVINGKLWWNDALYSAYGYSKKDHPTALEWWTAHIHPEDIKYVNRELEQLLVGKQNIWVGEYRFQKADKSYVSVRDHLFVVRDEHGKALRIVGSMLDITKQKELEQAKDEFISVASHQLRTPLGSIRWNLDLLLETQKELPPMAREQVQEAHLSTMRMLGLVADLLNVARIEQNRVQTIPTETNLIDIARLAIAEMKPIARARKITISLESDETLPIIYMDPKHIREVIQNLLSNAVKYTAPEGWVRCKMMSQKNEIIMSVSDNGIGIPKADQKQLFGKFFRASNVTVTDTEGSGLGLFVVKSFVKGWGGRIWFESETGKGTTFFVTIPLHTKSSKIIKEKVE